MKIALHICCAVCAAGSAESLIREGHEVRGFFYNPNIYPEEEYQLRLKNARKVAEQLGFQLVEGLYEAGEWNDRVQLLVEEPEGGRRCPVCYRLRLEKTHQYMLNSGCAAFTTTLTMGSNKSALALEKIGQAIGGETFLRRDFKKKDGFKRAGELARQWGLYRQHYCGCQYSLIQRANSK